MKLRGLLLGMFLCSGVASSGVALGQALHCDLKEYTPVNGVTAEAGASSVILTWQGEAGQQLRAQFTLRDGQPVVQELAARDGGGPWVVLGKDLSPDFQVTTGRRRISTTERGGLEKLGIDTPEREASDKWEAFWDAPLQIPGGSHTTEKPRTEAEIHRASVQYQSSTCKVATDGDRVSVTFNGLALGVFAGDLRFTAYKGSNLLRQEAIASTNEPSVAFIYKAGLKGFTIAPDTKLVWRDTSQDWQQYEFGGAPNQDPVGLRARNRLEILDAGSGSLAVFPPPHKFFFPRENEVNLGYVYYRKDNDSTFSLGVMQPERGEGYAPWGISDEEWKKRVDIARDQVENYALYNAPAGHPAAHGGLLLPEREGRSRHAAGCAGLYARRRLQATSRLQSPLRPLPSRLQRTASRPRHPGLTARLAQVFRSLGINILYLGDFHGDSHPNDPGPNRFDGREGLLRRLQRVSDNDFLVMPAEEPNAYFGGHLSVPPEADLLHSRHARPDLQHFEENDPVYGHVYHLGSARTC